MFYDELYCGHCWLWINDSLIDIENDKYSGQGSNWEEIKFFLNMNRNICKIF